MKGHISKRTRKDGGTSWLLKYDAGSDPKTGQRLQRYKTVRGSKKDAERKLRSLLSHVDKGTHVDRNRLTLGDWCETWIRTYKLEKARKTRERYAELLRLHVIPKLGSLKLQNVTGDDIQNAYAELLTSGGRRGQGLAARTVLHVHRLLSQVLAMAAKKRHVPRNAAEDVEAPEPKPTEIQVLDKAQLTMLLTGLQGRALYPLVALAAGTGMRRGELLALRWSDVNLLGQELSVKRSVEDTAAGGLRFKAPKSTAGTRDISLSANLVEVLVQHRKHLTRDANKCGVKLPDDSLVFPTSVFDPMTPRHPRAVTKEFGRWVRKMNLPKIGLHCLRHTHATLLLDQKLNPKVVSKRLGHSTVAITLEIYAHVTDEANREAAQVAGKILNDALPTLEPAPETDYEPAAASDSNGGLHSRLQIGHA